MEALRETFARHGQGHVFAAWDTLSEVERNELLADAKAVPLDELKSLFGMAGARHDLTDTRDSFSPWNDVHRPTAEDKRRHFDIGLEQGRVRAGKVAAILMAGGQGTRLGSKDPKGMFNVGLPSGKSLFQIQAERLQKLVDMAAQKGGGAAVAPIPWHVMTSEATDAQTEQFFRDNNYFGLPPSSVRFFEQGLYPALLDDGRIAMAARGRITMSPNGNGGIYEAVARTGVLAELKRTGVEFVFVYGVDNIAIRICDPAFIGLLKEQGGDCGVKVVPKDYPAERVGVVALRNGAPSVVEYSELDKHTAEKVGPDGRLLFNTGNICTHLYTIDFLERSCTHYQGLVKHVAVKAIPHYDHASGQTIVPPKENGFKFEMFVFDVFPLSKKLVALEVVREEEFLPLKNRDGSADSNPTTCRNGISALHRKYLRDAGATVVGEGMCEISPLVSYAGENLDNLRGRTLHLPLHLTPESIAKL